MVKCPAITRGSRPCKGLVRAGNDYCPAHDPGRQEARSRAASKAGRAKPSKEIADLKGRLEDLAADVSSGSVEPKVGAVVNQIINTRVRLMEAERKIRETEELEKRLEELEDVLNRKEEASGWR